MDSLEDGRTLPTLGWGIRVEVVVVDRMEVRNSNNLDC
jgi:hypothetical protein